MQISGLAIEEVKLVRPLRHSDPRGYFVETWNRKTLVDAGIDIDFVQDNFSFSHDAGTVRGLHYQRRPRAQAKLVRVARGSTFAVVVDLRRASATFGRHVTAHLSGEGGEQLFIPVGFAHGFCTLEAGTEVAYKVSDFHSRDHDAGILWNDPDIGIDWPLDGRQPILSDRDLGHPRLVQAAPGF